MTGCFIFVAVSSVETVGVRRDREMRKRVTEIMRRSDDEGE